MAVRQLRAEDIPAALALINEEGWNYTSIELERMLQLDPDGSYLFEDGHPIGIVMGVSYGRTGVIGHLVVSKKGRGRKIGQTLLNHSLDYFDSRGVESVALYATAEGEKLYNKYGFLKKRQALCVNARIPKVVAFPDALKAERLDEKDMPDAIALDSDLFGDDRRKLMDMLFKESVGHRFKLSKNGALVGFIFARESPVGYDVGPWVCTTGSAKDAMNLYAAAVTSLTRGTLFLAAFEQNKHSAALARSLDRIILWEVEYMVRGEDRYNRDPSSVYGITAFELG
jgi:ribosomal protein S18 acetylase RimI-like enzyme